MALEPQFKDDQDFNINLGDDAKPADEKPVTREELPKPSTNGGLTGFLQTANHPTVCIVHLAFKGLALFSYLFLNIFIDNLVLLFIVVVILNCMDFWVVKNVTGRILVSLRWWNRINEKGDNEWIYEGPKQKLEPNTDYRVFWYSLYVTPVIWALLLVLKILSISFFYANLCLISVLLTGANLYGYYHCDKEQANQLQKYGKSAVISYVANSLMGRQP